MKNQSNQFIQAKSLDFIDFSYLIVITEMKRGAGLLNVLDCHTTGLPRNHGITEDYCQRVGA